MGRPTVYTDEAAEEILRRLAEGESLTQICADGHLPCRRTVQSWAFGFDGNAPDTFLRDYERARSFQADGYFDEIIDASRDAMEDPRNEVTNATKLLTDNLKWRLARQDRGKYGDRSAVDIGGQDGAEIRFSWRSEAQAAPNTEET